MTKPTPKRPRVDTNDLDAANGRLRRLIATQRQTADADLFESIAAEADQIARHAQRLSGQARKIANRLDEEKPR